MKKKILTTFVVTLALAMVLTPMVGVVTAGKGQTKMDFEARLVVINDAENYDRMWETGNNRFFRGMGMITPPGGGLVHITIGADTITAEYLEVETSADLNVHLDDEGEMDWYTINVREVFKIYDSEDHNEGTLRGTLELVSLGASGPPATRQSFVGHGTGEFEGVKVIGTTTLAGIVVLPFPPFIFLDLLRQGTVMGWPTP